MKTFRHLSLLTLLASIGCGDDPSSVETPAGTEVGVIVSSTDRLLTIFSADSPQVRSQVGLGPDGSPVTIAVRGQTAIVPLGILPAAAVVDLVQKRVTATVPLPANSGATGAAFINDSIALVANPGRNSVTPVNVRRGSAAAEITVGGYPQAIVAFGDTAYVLNANLGADFKPTRTGTITVLAGSTPRAIGTIELSGFNPGAAAAGPNGTIYVINSGSFGAADGSLSTVDRRTLRETRRDDGFGDFPGAITVLPDGRVLVGAFAYGVVVWQPATRTFVRAPSNAIQPGGIASTSGLGIDSNGRVYALEPECRTPASAFRLSATFQLDTEITTGICPLAIAFTRLPE